MENPILDDLVLCKGHVLLGLSGAQVSQRGLALHIVTFDVRGLILNRTCRYIIIIQKIISVFRCSPPPSIYHIHVMVVKLGNKNTTRVQGVINSCNYFTHNKHSHFIAPCASVSCYISLLQLIIAAANIS